MSNPDAAGGRVTLVLQIRCRHGTMAGATGDVLFHHFRPSPLGSLQGKSTWAGRLADHVGRDRRGGGDYDGGGGHSRKTSPRLNRGHAGLADGILLLRPIVTNDTPL